MKNLLIKTLVLTSLPALSGVQASPAKHPQNRPPLNHRPPFVMQPPVAQASVATGTDEPVLSIDSQTPATVNNPQFLLRGKIRHAVYATGLINATLNGQRLNLERDGSFAANIRLNPGANNLTLRATTPNPRQQVTNISTFIDASMVYGSDSARSNALRTFTGGLLKTSDGNLLPLNTDGFANANDAHIFPNNELFLAGDVRANENVELVSTQTLFMREHNSLANAIATANPGLSDEDIFQRARRIVIAEIQAVTYNEFLPALLGPVALRPYQGYNPDVAPGLATEFSTAGFRIGHTLINDDVEFLDNDAEEIIDGLPLAFAFFNPDPIKVVGPDPVLKYLATDNAQEVDPQIVDGLRDFLFGPPGAGGLDLASLNIQRGRDHGLADYNSVRVAYGLPAVTSFADITSDPDLQTKLATLYRDVTNIDLWIAGLAEDHLPSSSVGPTFSRIIAQQFERTRDGDRNWFENTFRGPQLDALRATRLSDIIRRNTTITKIQDNVFFYDPATTLASLTELPGSLPATLLSNANPLRPLPPAASLNGTGNNPFHSTWGSAGRDLLRFSRDAYADGISTPSGATRPGARLISNTVCVHTATAQNNRNMSSWVYGWGQFIDHDLGLTTTTIDTFNIPVPTGDPSFDPYSDGNEVISLHRSNYDTSTGTSTPTVASTTLSVTFTPPPPPQQPPRRR